MTLPGTTVTIRDSAPPRSAPTDSSVWFVTGFAEQGPLSPVLVQSMADYANTFGARVTYGLLYDALDVFFREGGSKAYVGRAVGPTPVKAAHTFLDGSAGNSLVVSAETYGDWANNISVAISHPDGTHYVLTVSYNGTVVETSPSFTTTQQAVDWSVATSKYLSIALGASSLIPAVATASLTGGTDDHANATETQWENALALFTPDLGPGQVSAPGRTTDQAHLDLLAHAAAYNRVALVDGADTTTAATLITAAGQLRSNGAFGAMFAPWAVVPGVVGGTTRTIPYSAIEAGIMARNDSAGLSPNKAAAGQLGESSYALSLSQPAWTDADRELLNNAGVNVARVILGGVRTYGYRTLANPATAPASRVQLSTARLLMEIVARCRVIGERYEFGEIDGRGFELSEYGGDLAAELNDWWNQGSLYGATAQEAYAVDVGAQVNTAATIAAGQINAQLQVRVSPFGETVNLYITNRQITEAVI